MSDRLILLNSPRSRAPINEEGEFLWDILNGTLQRNQLTLNENPTNDTIDVEPKTKDKSTSTTPENEPKYIVLRKWKERQTKAAYELARKTIINSIKEKFGSCPDIDTYTNTDVEDASNSNVNQMAGLQGKIEGNSEDFRVDFCGGHKDGVCHAKFQEPGGAVAQWRPGARGSKAGAAAAGGLRGISKEMPTSSSGST